MLFFNALNVVDEAVRAGHRLEFWEPMVSDAVAAVESKATGDYVVRRRDGRELAGSRRYRRPLLAD